MLHTLRRHPFPVEAHFEACLVLTYAYPAPLLARLLPPGLEVDRYGDLGFLAVALVQTRGLRPAGFPRWVGRDFFLAGYRVLSRYRGRDGVTRRGLRILRSQTDRSSMRVFGNLLTNYHYTEAKVLWERDGDRLDVEVKSDDRGADLRLAADLSSSAGLPKDSPFADLRAARRFAGPLPFTFDFEVATRSMIVVKGVREAWRPEPVRVEVSRCTFLERPPLSDADPWLASAFYVSDVPYRWERGVREPLEAVT